MRARQAAKGGKLTAEHIHLSFGPSDKFIGKQFQGDPNVNEATLTLGPFSVITWLKQFPDWSMTARLMPAPPPAPGVAIRKAAALAEGKDPDKAVAEARAKVTPVSACPSHLSALRLPLLHVQPNEPSPCSQGELLKKSQLPAPWGPKAYKPDQQALASYRPQEYPVSISAA